MSQRSPKRPQPHVTQGPGVDLSEEEGKALYEASLRLDNGTAMIVQNALDTIADRPHTGRNLLDVVVRLIGHMTPEQKRGLAERLPALLGDAAPPPTNGVPHSEAG
jgi:hypothetical protein